MALRRTKDIHREQQFAKEYVIDFNGARAATAAGYAPGDAKVTASRLLTRANVKKTIDVLLQKQASKLEFKAVEIARELYKLGFSNILDYVKVNAEGQMDIDLSTITRDQAAAIQEITVDTTGGTGDGERRKVLRTKFKLANKRDALELLGQHLKMFTTKFEGTLDVTNLTDEEIAERLSTLLPEKK